MIILLAVLALVVVNALRDSPWGLFTIASTIPIALLMGWWMKVVRPGKVLEASIRQLRSARQRARSVDHWVSAASDLGGCVHVVRRRSAGR